jgi:hypothetical protein
MYAAQSLRAFFGRRTSATRLLTAAAACESLERRRLLYAADMPGLSGLNALRSDYPAVQGQGQVVVVMDTGVNGVNYGPGNFVHPGLNGKIWNNSADPVGDAPFNNPDGNPDDDRDGLVDNVHGWNYYHNDRNAFDNNGHGTAVSSVIAAEPFSFDEDGGGPAPVGNYQGVAPDVTILPIKIAHYTYNPMVDHWTTKERLNAAFKWVYDNATRLNIVAVNMSWGFYGATRGSNRWDGDRPDSSPSEADYYYAPTGGQSIAWYVDHLRTDKRVLIAQAAANNDNNLWHYPSREVDEIACVSSLNASGTDVWGDDDSREVNGTGSAYGQDASYVDVFAPGWNVVANSTNNGYTLYRGPTSFATPWVAGAAALLRQVRPSYTPAEIMSVLRTYTDRTVHDSRPLDERNYTWNATDPVINLHKAVARARAFPASGPVSVPGTIEAENFDHGADGVAYHDTTAGNYWNTYRTNVGVDITTSTAEGGNILGLVNQGEWLEYTINVPAAGTYKLELRVASDGPGGLLQVKADNVDKTGNWQVPNTGGWDTWQTISRNVTLSAGVQVLRLNIIQNGTQQFPSVGNLNWLRLGTTTAPTRNARQTIEAETLDGSGGSVTVNTSIGSLDTNDWVLYRGVDFGSPNVNTFTMRYAVGVGFSGRFKLRLDSPTGPEIGTILTSDTGGWGAYVQRNFTITPGASGVHDLYLTFETDGTANIDWFRFA